MSAGLREANEHRLAVHEQPADAPGQIGVGRDYHRLGTDFSDDPGGHFRVLSGRRD